MSMRPKKLVQGNKALASFDIKQESKKMEDKLNQLKTLFKKQKDERQQAVDQSRTKLTQRWSTKGGPEGGKKPSQSQQQIETKPTQGSSSEVREFLEKINLQQYEQKLIDAGVDSLDILRGTEGGDSEMKKQHLEEVGIPKGHIVKILKYLNGTQVKQQPPTIKCIALAEIHGTTNKTNLVEANAATQPKGRPSTATFEQCQTEECSSLEKRLFCQACFLPFSSPSINPEPFCSKKCLNKHRLQNYVQCQGCHAYYQKWNCFKHDDSYYCSEACIKPVLEQLERNTGLLTEIGNDEKDMKASEGVEEDEFYLIGEEQKQEDLPIDLNEFLEMQRYLRTPL